MQFAPYSFPDYSGIMSAKLTENLDPDLPASEFAQSVLAFRMDVVESLLPLAAYHAADEVEHVHRLRVACRRASAALRAFAPLMKRKPRKLKRWISMIRGAAGPARDADVLLARFVHERPDGVTDYALARLSAERTAAQQALVGVAERATRGKLDRVVERTLKLLDSRNDSQGTLAAFGQHALEQAYLPFRRLADLEEPTIDELHQLRIAGKRVRYSLELFRTIFPNELHQQTYGLVEKLQTRLGEINDHATAQRLYQVWLGELPADGLSAGIAARVVQEYQQTERLAQRFMRWWKPERVSQLRAMFDRLC